MKDLTIENLLTSDKWGNVMDSICDLSTEILCLKEEKSQDEMCEEEEGVIYWKQEYQDDFNTIYDQIETTIFEILEIDID